MDFQAFNDEYNRLYKEENSLYHRLARRFGLSDSAFWILYTLEASPRPITQAELCGCLWLSKQTINSALKGLELDGHLRLVNAPGRGKHIRLTDRGAALARRTVRPVLELEERAFLAMTAEEQTALMALARRYLELLKRESAQFFDMPREEL